MARVFLSYAREDVRKAQAVASALERAGHQVWWDHHLQAGAEYSRRIDDELAGADAIVVLWSRHSVESPWVRDEAAAGRDSGRLVPVRIGKAEPPLGFRQYQTLNLSAWRGKTNHTSLDPLIAAVSGAESKAEKTASNGENRLFTGEAMRRAVAPKITGESHGVDRRTALSGAAGLVVLGGAGVWWYTTPPDASDDPLYRKGVEALRISGAEGNAQAIGFLRQAVTLRPKHADAWGKLAIAYEMSRVFLPPGSAVTARQRAESAARRALELDPRNANAHAARALAEPRFGRWLEAEAAWRKVLSLDSRQFEANSWLSQLLGDVGRTLEAISTLDRIAREAEMQSNSQQRLARLLSSADRVEDSDRVIERAMELWPRNYAVWFTRYWLLVHSGRAQQALAQSADIAARPAGIPGDSFALADLGARAIMTKQPSDIEAAVSANLGAARMGAGLSENAIKICSALGRLDEAFAVAKAYYFGRGFVPAPVRFTTEQGVYTTPDRRLTAFLFEPSTGPMRNDSRFPGLVNEIGLSHYWRRSGKLPDAARALPAASQWH